MASPSSRPSLKGITSTNDDPNLCAVRWRVDWRAVDCDRGRAREEKASDARSFEIATNKYAMQHVSRVAKMGSVSGRTWVSGSG